MAWIPKLHWVERPGRKPYAVCTIGGKQHYCGTAPAAAHRKFASILQDHELKERKPIYVAEGILAYQIVMKSEFERGRLNAFLAWRRDLLLLDVTDEVLTEYVAHMQTEPNFRIRKKKDAPARTIRPKTVGHNLSVLMKFLKWCASKPREWIQSVPIAPKLAPVDLHPRDIPSTSLPDLLSKIPTHAWPIFGFLLYTGCRSKEARILRWKWVREADGVCEIPAEYTKKRRVRTIVLNPQAKTILAGQPRDREFVFCSQHGTPYSYAALRSCLRRAGWNGVHAFRHTFAQLCLDQDWDQAQLAEWLGHADLRTVKRYAQIRQRHLSRKAQTLVLPERSPAAVHPSASTPSKPSRKSAPAKKSPKSARANASKSADRKGSGAGRMQRRPVSVRP